MEFRDGVAGGAARSRSARPTGAAPKCISWRRRETFGSVDFHYDILAQAAARAVVPQQRRKIELIDQRDGKEENFAFAGGVKGFVEYMNRSKTVLHPNIFHAVGEKDGITVEVAMQWNDSYSENVQCFTNNIPQRDGGTHLTGLRAAMTRTLNKYIEEDELAKKAKVETTGDDMREGLTCVLSVKVPEPKFSLADQGQARVVRSARPGARRSSAKKLSDFLLENPADAQDHLRQDRRRGARARSGAQGARDDAPQGRARRHGPARQARRLPGDAIRRCASSTSSRATPPAARPSRAATASSRRSCR